MTTALILLAITCFLAYSNGANDNFKGVATLFGSNTLTYHQALWWSTATTFAGSVCSIFLAEMLLKSFSGKGLVPDQIVASPDFAMAVALGAGITVLLTALKGVPISTTHALIGALLGSGVMAVGSEVNFSVLGAKFFLPLLVSPLLALSLGAVVYFIFRYFRQRTGISKEWCLCVGSEQRVVPAGELAMMTNASVTSGASAVLDTNEQCVQRYQGTYFGIGVQKLLDVLHIISGGMVCFARGVNDTPKIVALLLAISALSLEVSMFAVALAMALGGLLNARRIANTMGRKITSMTHGQGFSANLVTAFLVIFASKLGVPVSTTHVSVGSIFGIGLVSGQGDKSVMSGIFAAWLLTLPTAALFAALSYWMIS